MGRSGGRVTLKGINRAGYWPSGNPRCYYRPKGQKGIALPDYPMEHPRFLKAYAEACGGDAELPRSHATGSLGAAILAYMASDTYLALASTTRAQRRRILEKLRRAYGDLRLAGLQARHIRKDIARLEPIPANNRLKAWRGLCRWSVDAGLVDHDAARDVRPRPVPKSDGFTPWERDDLVKFRQRWPIGTPQRLCMELIYQTAGGMADVVRMGPGMVENGWLTYTRRKSGTIAACPLLVAGPAWFEGEDYLGKCIEARPLALTYLSTAQGRPRSEKAASQWFSKACRDAGLQGKSAHGLRKLRAAMFRENGATKDQRMAILGHETETEADHYAKSADLQKVITGTEVTTPVQLSAKSI